MGARAKLVIYALNVLGLWPPKTLAVTVALRVGKQLATSISESHRTSIGCHAASLECWTGICL